MADRDVDELFGGTDAPRPRFWTIAMLLVAGSVTVVLGLACSVIPGLLVLAWAWNVVETDWHRIVNGYYPIEQRSYVIAARVITYVVLVAGLIVLVGQWYLLDFGFYHALWSAVIEALLAAIP